MDKKVIVVAPGKKTRGGISTVLLEYKKTRLWTDYNFKWIDTYIDKSVIHKILYFIKAYIYFIYSVNSYQIVYIHFSWPSTAIRKMFFFIVARLLNKKIILHLHSGSEKIITTKIRFIYQYMFKNADLTILLADKIRNELNEHYHFKKTAVIYNPSLVVKRSIQKIKSQKEKHILFAGTLFERKGYKDLIKAFSLIAKKYPEWKIVFAGNGEIETARILAKFCGIEDQIIFKGWVIEKEELFLKSSIFCLPSYTEGFPMAVLDAWAFGLPVITTPVGGLPDFIIDEENALIVNPGDIIGLSKAIEKLIENEDLRKKIVIQAQSLCNTIFNLNTITDQLYEIFDGIETI